MREVDFQVLSRALEALLRKLFGSLISVTSLTCSICWRPDFITTKPVIDVIASHLINLESLTIWTREPLKEEDLDALVGLLSLKSGTLRLVFPEKSVSGLPKERPVEVVKRFRSCAQLVQLDIDDVSIKSRSQLIAEAAAKYCREDFYMFIGCVQYGAR